MSHIRIALIQTILFLAGCAGPGQLATTGTEHVGPYPENWEYLVRDYIKANFADPYSIRDAMAAPPYRNSKLFYDTWTVCVRLNAKNQMGGYSGLTYYSFGIKNNAIDLVRYGNFDCERTSGAKALQYRAFIVE